MTATVTPLPLATRPPDPASHAALAELVQICLAVARTAGRLAAVEDAAIDALAAATVAATHALAEPASLDDARRAGHAVDLGETARDAAVARIAVIGECVEKAARALRRTVALQARLAAGRPFQDARPFPTPPFAAAQHRTAPSPPVPRPGPAGDTEYPDRPETGDELGAATDEDVLGSIHHDLDRATSEMSRLDPAPGRAGVTPSPSAPAHGPVPHPLPRPRSGEHQSGGRHPSPSPAPDT